MKKYCCRNLSSNPQRGKGDNRFSAVAAFLTDLAYIPNPPMLVMLELFSSLQSTDQIILNQ